jgi:hypothetical protein
MSPKQRKKEKEKPKETASFLPLPRGLQLFPTRSKESLKFLLSSF